MLNTKRKVLEFIDQHTDEIYELYNTLHSMPEKSWEEIRTSAFLKAQIENAGMEIKTCAANTGLLGILSGKEKGHIISLRADMDALPFNNNGKTVFIHACGHDANCAMVMFAAITLARVGLPQGTLKIVFQPAEEGLGGAQAILQTGWLDDVTEMVGIHLRPAQEAELGEACAALHHGAHCVIKATIRGISSHGARPHLGVNAIDAAVSIINGLNTIHIDTIVPHSAKPTRLIAGTAHNIIPAEAKLVLDLRAQTNETISMLKDKVQKVIEKGAALAGAQVVTDIISEAPAACYNEETVLKVNKAIEMILGKVKNPIVTPGSEDFHYYSLQGGIKTAYIGLGANLYPGLHHPGIKFDLKALVIGTKILACYVIDSLLAHANDRS